MAARLRACFAFVAARFLSVSGHPLCTDYSGPKTEIQLSFCSQLNGNPDGVCCDSAGDAAVQKLFLGTAGVNAASATCKELYRDVLCIRCHPWASHLTGELWDTLGVDGYMLTQSFCANLTSSCSGAVAFASDFCAVHTDNPDPYYSYPFERAADFTGQTQLSPAFPNLPMAEIRKALVDMRMTPDGDAWWIVSEAGQIYEQPSAVADATSWKLILDITSKVYFDNECGLLSVAFSPAFARTGHFYVVYSYAADTMRWRLSRFTLSNDDTAATASSEVVLIDVEHLYQNHFGGWVGFRPSDYKGTGPDAASHDLYVSAGDGGAHDDPNNHGQNLGSILGKMLRISVFAKEDLGDKKYGIPSDNPLVGQGGDVLEEVWAWGLRNPWRCSFDRETEDLWCADVGQMRIEEINIVEVGRNYGWGAYEGTRCNAEGPIQPCTELDASDVTMPVMQYCHTGLEGTTDSANTPADACGDGKLLGTSVTGGFVYRGTQFKDIFYGDYIFADYGSNWIARGRQNATTKAWAAAHVIYAYAVSAFAEDHDGEIYALSYSAAGIGGIYKLSCGDLCDDYSNPNPDPISSDDDGTGGKNSTADGNGGSTKNKDDGFAAPGGVSADSAPLVLGITISAAAAVFLAGAGFVAWRWRKAAAASAASKELSEKSTPVKARLPKTQSASRLVGGVGVSTGGGALES